MRFLRTNTAVRVTIGPFFDKTDGVTPEVALTVTAIKLTFMVDDGNVPTLVLDTNPTASGGNNDMAHVTGDDAGFYDLELTAANTNFLGRAMLALTDAANHCPVFHEFMILPAMIYDSLVLGTDRLDTNVTHIADTSQTARDIGASVLLAADQAVNTTKFGGTTVTGRDIGASVLLSPGTSTGQLDFTSGVVKSNLSQILGTALTETAGLIAAGFKKFFNVATPTGTLNSLPDAAPDAAGGLPVTGTRLTAIPTLPATLVSGRIDASVGAMAANVLTATAINADAITDAKVASDVTIASVTGSVGSVTSGVTVSTNNDKTGYGLSTAAVLAIWDALTSTLTTAGSIGKWVLDKLDVVVSTRLASSSYTAPLDAAGVRSAVGLASANLDTQLSTIDDFLDTEIAAIKAKTDNLPASPAATGDIPTVAAIAQGMFLEDSGQVFADAIAGSVVKEVADNAGGSAPTASEIAVAVRNNLLGSRDANILFLEAGGASTGGLHLYKEIGGTPTVDTTTKPPEAYSSIKIDDSGQWVRTNCGGAGKISFDFYTEALPSANESILLTEDSSASPDPIIDLRIGPDGLLHWLPVTGAGETSGSQVLSAGAWNKITLCFNDHGTVDNLDAKVYINGTQDISITGQGSNGITAGQFRFHGTSADGGPFYFANLYVDDNPDLTYPGDIRTTAKFGTTVNVDDFDTTGGTGAVNERPLDESNYRQQAGSSQVRQNYTLQAASEGDTDVSGKTIIGIMGWIRAKKSTPFGGAGTPAITIDGKDYSIAAAITASPATILKVVNESTYPSNAAGIGMISGGTSVDYFVYELGVVLAYVDPIIPTAEAVADAVWDEDIVGAHQTADTAGNKLSQALILYEGS